MKGFSGAFDQLTGSVETLMINALTPFMEKTLTPLVQQITTVINAIGAWAVANPELSNTVFTVTAVIAGLSATLVVVGVGLSAAGTAVGALGAAFGVMGTAVTLATGPIGILVAGIGILVATVTTLLPGIVESWGEAFRQIGIFIQNVVDKVSDLIAKIGEAVRALPGLKESSGDRNRSSFENLLEGREFARGGYTGDGPVNEVAGVVHRGEYVLSQDMLRMLGGGGNSGGRKVADTVNIYADTREGGYAAAQGFDEELRFALRS
jgi:hypothetical protein